MPRMTMPDEVNNHDPEVQAPEVLPDPETEATAPAKKGRGRPAKAKQEALTLTGQNTSLTEVAGLKGEVSAADMNVPPLNLVQKDSKIDNAFPGGDCPGNFFFSSEVNLGKEIDVIICSADRKYQEDKPYDPNSLPKAFDSAEAAQAEGVYKLNNLAILDLLVVVPADSEDAEVSAHQDENFAYIPCRYFVSGRAFSSVYSALVTAITIKKDTCTYARTYKMSARLAPARGKTLYQAFLTAKPELLTNDQLVAARSMGAGQ